jgi:hypothetical protein
MVPVETRAIVTALRNAMLAPERVDRTTAVDGIEMRFEFSPLPDVDIRITTQPAGRPDEQAGVTMYNPAPAPPDSYPLDLPFLAGVRVSVWEQTAGPPGRRSATWMSVPDVAAAEAQILEQCASGGWVIEAPPVFTANSPVRTHSLRHGSRVRAVTTSHLGMASMITLLDAVEE